MDHTKHMAQAAESCARTVALWQALPFDLARQQYAAAVQVGLIKRSMLAWAKFERDIDLLEKLTLGPWARRV